MLDCHAHLTDPSFAEGLDEVLEQAEAVGVTGIITVSESLVDAKQVIGRKLPKPQRSHGVMILLLRTSYFEVYIHSFRTYILALYKQQYRAGHASTRYSSSTATSIQIYYI